MVRLTLDILKQLHVEVKAFNEALMEAKIEEKDMDDQYNMVIEAVKNTGWKCSALTYQFFEHEKGEKNLITSYEIYINIGYGSYVMIHIDNLGIDLAPVDWADLEILRQNSFIGTNIDYYAEAQNLEFLLHE